MHVLKPMREIQNEILATSTSSMVSSLCNLAMKLFLELPGSEHTLSVSTVAYHHSCGIHIGSLLVLQEIFFKMKYEPLLLSSTLALSAVGN